MFPCCLSRGVSLTASLVTAVCSVYKPAVVWTADVLWSRTMALNVISQFHQHIITLIHCHVTGQPQASWSAAERRPWNEVTWQNFSGKHSQLKTLLLSTFLLHHLLVIARIKALSHDTCACWKCIVEPQACTKMTEMGLIKEEKKTWQWLMMFGDKRSPFWLNTEMSS